MSNNNNDGEVAVNDTLPKLLPTTPKTNKNCLITRINKHGCYFLIIAAEKMTIA